MVEGHRVVSIGKLCRPQSRTNRRGPGTPLPCRERTSLLAETLICLHLPLSTVHKQESFSESEWDALELSTYHALDSAADVLINFTMHERPAPKG